MSASTKSFSNLNEIWNVGRGRWLIHCEFLNVFDHFPGKGTNWKHRTDCKIPGNQLKQNSIRAKFFTEKPSFYSGKNWWIPDSWQNFWQNVHFLTNKKFDIFGGKILWSMAIENGLTGWLFILCTGILQLTELLEQRTKSQNLRRFCCILIL